jgi:hypothetical protein
MNSLSTEPDSALWLLTQIYANRSVSLWKIPETLAWLNSTLQSSASEMKSIPRAGPAAFSVAGPSFVKSVVRHAIVSDLKPLAPFIGSILSALGPQEGYDIVRPDGEGVTAYDEQYFSTASAKTAKKRREGPSGGRRRGRDEVEVDPFQLLDVLERALTFDADIGERGRNEILGLMQQGNGVRVLEVRTSLFWRRIFSSFFL